MNRTNGMNEHGEEVCTTELMRAATRIYDAVYWFCETYLNTRSIMADQMLRSARSGRMNVAKALLGREVSVPMKRRYIHLAGVQYDGLLLDCGDYLRHRRLKQWDDLSPEAAEIKEMLPVLSGTSSGEGGQAVFSEEEAWARFSPWLEHEEPAVRINALICMIRHLHLQMDQLPCLAQPARTDELSSGVPKHELAHTAAGNPEPRAASPDCPQCGRPMVKRTAKTGKAAGRPFWGCTGYPECKGIVNA